MKQVNLTVGLWALFMSSTLLAECPGDVSLQGEELKLSNDLQKIVKELPYAVDDHVLHIQISETKEEKSGGPHFTCFDEGTDKKCSYVLKNYDNLENLKLDLPKILPSEYAEQVTETVNSKFEEGGSYFAGQRLSVVIALDNDSRMYSAVRNMVKGPHEDDEGFSHGLAIDASTTLPNLRNIKLGAGYSTQMYTLGLPEKELEYCQGLYQTEAEVRACQNKTRMQYFDNVNKGYLSGGQNPESGFNWNVQLGYLELNHEKESGAWNGTYQQHEMHKLFGITVPKNYKDGKGVERGFFTKISGGYQSVPFAFWDNRILVSGKADADINVSNVSKYSSFKLNEEIHTKIQSRGGMVGMGIISKTAQLFHGEGVESTLVIGGEFFAGPFVLKYEDTTYFGKLHNYADYNLPSARGGDTTRLEKTGTVFIMVDFNHWARRRYNAE